MEIVFTNTPLNQVADISINELFTETEAIENLDPNHLR